MVRVHSPTLISAAALLFLATATTTATPAFVPPHRLVSLRPTVLDATNLKTTTKEETILLNEDKFLADLDAQTLYNRMGREQVEVFGEPRYIVEARRKCAALAGRAQELQDKYSAEIKMLRNKSVWDTTIVVQKKTKKKKGNHSFESRTMASNGGKALLALALAGAALVVPPEAVTDVVSTILHSINNVDVTLPTIPAMSHFELPIIELPTVGLTSMPSLDDFQLPAKLPTIDLPKRLETSAVTGWFQDLKTQMPNMVPLSVEATVRGWQDTVASKIVDSSSSLWTGWFHDLQTKIQGASSLLDEAGWQATSLVDSSFSKVEATHTFKTNTMEPSLMSSEDLSAVLREWLECMHE